MSETLEQSDIQALEQKFTLSNGVVIEGEWRGDIFHATYLKCDGELPRAELVEIVEALGITKDMSIYLDDDFAHVPTVAVSIDVIFDPRDLPPTKMNRALKGGATPLLPQRSNFLPQRREDHPVLEKEIKRTEGNAILLRIIFAGDHPMAQELTAIRKDLERALADLNRGRAANLNLLAEGVRKDARIRSLIGENREFRTLLKDVRTKLEDALKAPGWFNRNLKTAVRRVLGLEEYED